MDVVSFFSKDYAQARRSFLSAAVTLGARLSEHPHPKRGPGDEALACDVAWVGSADATRAVVALSGTHGAEGFCGSGIQVALLSNLEQVPLPAGTALVLIHAINPFGFAWLRRVTEDNVDLNRNFVDHAKGGYPANPGYAALAEAIVPRDWTAVGRAEAQRTLDAYADRHGLFGLQSAISAGQYDYPGGLFYGGRDATWSRRTLASILQEDLAAVRHAALIDIHTGLGPKGYGEPINTHPPGAAGHDRARAWFGPDVTSPEGGSSSSAIVHGHLGEGIVAAAPHIDWTSIALEYGTHPISDVLDALRADAWLHAYGAMDSPQGRQIKADVRDAFYCEEPAWMERVWTRALEMLQRAAQGLAKDTAL